MMVTKEEKQILNFLVKKELKTVKEEEKDIKLASLKFIKSMDTYEEKLKELSKKLR